MSIAITAMFAGVNALINVGLAFDVSRNRGKAKVFLGTGEAPELLIAARRHANNAEYLPLALVMMLIVELGGGGAGVLYALGGLLTLGRIIHPIGLGTTISPLRVGGALLTWLSIAGSAIFALMQSMQ